MLAIIVAVLWRASLALISVQLTSGARIRESRDFIFVTPCFVLR